jgi:hypothetical protein
MLCAMADEPIVFSRAEAPISVRSRSQGTRAQGTRAQGTQAQGTHALASRTEARDTRIRFDRLELTRILNLYGRMVAAGEGRDYAIDFCDDAAVFSIFRRTSEMALYRVEKRPKLKDRQGQYAVVAAGGQVLKRGHELVNVLHVLERKLFKAVASQ